MTASLRNEMWKYICDMRHILRLLFTLLIAFFLLSLFSLLFVESGTAEYAIVRFNLIYASVFLILIGFVIFRCQAD